MSKVVWCQLCAYFDGSSMKLLRDIQQNYEARTSNKLVLDYTQHVGVVSVTGCVNDVMAFIGVLAANGEDTLVSVSRIYDARTYSQRKNAQVQPR